MRTVAVTKDKKVYVGGDIDSVNGQPAGGLAMFDGATWSTLGALYYNPTPNALCLKRMCWWKYR